ARVSEAHAMVSLRGGQLKLLALRGRLAIDTEPLTELVLEPGLDVRLAKGVSLGVSGVDLPDHALAIEGSGLPRTVLEAQSASLLVDGPPVLQPGFVDGAAAYLWSDGEGYVVRVGDAAARRLADGVRWRVGDLELSTVKVGLDRIASSSTRLQGRLHPPLRIVVRFDTASVQREGHPAVGLGGMSARIVSELVALDGPVHWSALASEIWRELTDELPLRRRWDRNLARLRAKLREAGVRPDLIRSDGSGMVELFLYDGDTAVDRT
ncbi:MAG: hypothetical protein AAF211_02260, partial [Myxococcota bacterium]